MNPDLYFKGLTVKEDWYDIQRHGGGDDREMRGTEVGKEGEKMEER